jgi:hypothetical protein
MQHFCSNVIVTAGVTEGVVHYTRRRDQALLAIQQRNLRCLSSVCFRATISRTLVFLSTRQAQRPTVDAETAPEFLSKH